MSEPLDHTEPDAEEFDWVAAFAARHPARIRHIATAPAVPIGVSMNACIKQARGRLLAIWNVDDLRTPGSLEATVDGDFTVVTRPLGSTEQTWRVGDP